MSDEVEGKVEKSADELLSASDDDLEPYEKLKRAAYLAELESGVREVSEERVKRSLFMRLAIIIGGSLIVVLGVVLLVLPGPGLIVVAFGLTLLALEVPFAARMLERIKDRLPKDADGKLPRSAIVMMVAMVVLASGLSIAWTVAR